MKKYNKIAIPIFCFLAFSALGFNSYNYFTAGLKNVYGTAIKGYEAWLCALIIGLLAFCISLIIVKGGSNDGNDGDDFDYNGGGWSSF